MDWARIVEKNHADALNIRIQTIQVLKDVGLHWMNCVEPVDPEHSIEEIEERMFLAHQYKTTYSGCDAPDKLSGLAHAEIRHDNRAGNGQDG
ncbi:MAG: hypothetical protein ACOC9D_02445 [Thermodesulfobacteriota bacterium]